MKPSSNMIVLIVLVVIGIVALVASRFMTPKPVPTKPDVATLTQKCNTVTMGMALQNVQQIMGDSETTTVQGEEIINTYGPLGTTPPINITFNKATKQVIRSQCGAPAK